MCENIVTMTEIFTDIVNFYKSINIFYFLNWEIDELIKVLDITIIARYVANFSRGLSR